MEVYLHLFLSSIRSGIEYQFDAPVTLPRAKFSWYPLDRRLTGSCRRCERLGESRDVILLPGNEPLFFGCVIRSAVTVPAPLSLVPQVTHFQVFPLRVQLAVVCWYFGIEKRRKSGLASARHIRHIRFPAERAAESICRPAADVSYVYLTK